MNARRKLLLLELFIVNLSAFGQSVFSNLDFESANVPDTAPSEYGGLVPESAAIPGWSSHMTEQHTILHNDLSTGGAAVILYGPSWPDSRYILDGKYSLALEGYGIWQTGQVPEDSKSLLFYAFTFTGAPPAIGVTFAGSELPFIELRDRGSYLVYGADISSFAGQTGELRFSSTALSATILDDIRFSTLAVPEPGTATLLLGGMGLLGLDCWRRRKSDRGCGRRGECGEVG